MAKQNQHSGAQTPHQMLLPGPHAHSLDGRPRVRGWLSWNTSMALCKDLLLEMCSGPVFQRSEREMPKKASVRAAQQRRVSTLLRTSPAEFKTLLFQTHLLPGKHFLSRMETETVSLQLIQRRSPQINQTNGEENQWRSLSQISSRK